MNIIWETTPVHQSCIGVCTFEQMIPNIIILASFNDGLLLLNKNNIFFSWEYIPHDFYLHGQVYSCVPVIFDSVLMLRKHAVSC